MELGQLLKQARLEAGLSQRALCGDKISRNMLSLIENGSARPSMDTLEYLAQRLGRPMSYFLQERTAVDEARQAYGQGDYRRAMTLAEQAGDSWEGALLQGLCALALAEQALAQGRLPYAAQLLEDVPETPYWVPALERQRLILMAMARPGSELPPADDRELLIRACQAQPQRALEYLQAAENRENPQWQLLMGQTLLALERYAEAIPYLQTAEERFPAPSAAALERCYEALEDYRNAYRYACKIRDDKIAET